MKLFNFSQILSYKLLLCLLGLSILITSCKNDDDDAPAPNTIVNVASGNANFSILASAVVKAGLAETLSGTTKYTVFAPTNAAFEAAGITQATIDNFAAGDPALQEILLYHVLAGEVRAADVSTGLVTTAATSNNQMYINAGDAVKINGTVTVTQTDLLASNGVIHVVDAVIEKPDNIATTATNITATASNADAGFSFLLAAINEAGLNLNTIATNNGGTLTVFAPTNAAFKEAGLMTEAAVRNLGAAALTEILQYHIVAGRVFSSDLTDAANPATLLTEGNLYVSISDAGVFLNEAQVTATDVLTTDGVIHVIDRVISTGSIADFVTRNPSFSLLTAGLTAAATSPIDLPTALSSAGTYTIFAPSNAAFNASGFAASANVTALGASTLQSVISLHGLGSEVYSSGVPNASVASLEGSNLTFSTVNGVTVTDPSGNTRNITKFDLRFSNGVVHVIDGVLLPQ